MGGAEEAIRFVCERSAIKYETVFACDFDAKCRDTLNVNHDVATVYDDICKVAISVM